MAKDYQEAVSLFEFCKTYSHPLAIRYGVGYYKDEVVYKRAIKLGEWVNEKQSSSSICVISMGPAICKLLDKNLDVTIVNAIFQSPINIEVLKSLLDYKHIIIYDPYAFKGRCPYQVLAALKELNYENQVHIIGIENKFIQKGTIEQQERRCKVHIDDVIKLIAELKMSK